MERREAQRKRDRAEEAIPRNVAPRVALPSKLAALLLYYWSWGFLSLPFLQRIACAAAADLQAAGGAGMKE